MTTESLPSPPSTPAFDGSPPLAQRTRHFTEIDPDFTPAPITRLQVALVVAAGIGFDLALRRGVVSGAAVALFLVGAAAVVGLSGLVRGRWAFGLLAASVPFSLMLALRADPRLTAFNLIAAVGLIILSAAHQRLESLLDYRPANAVADGLKLVVLVLTAPFKGAAEVVQRSLLAASQTRFVPVAAVGRGVFLALPVVLVLGWLLASADLVFVAVLDLIPVSIAPGLGHLALIALGSVLIAAVLQLAVTGERTHFPAPSGLLGRTEVTIILGSIAALFCLFSVSQVLAVLGVGDGALEAAGTTYRDYARQGFFQLLWVAGLTLLILLSVNVLGQPGERYLPVVRTLNWTVIALTLLIVFVAFRRLSLYIADDGLTPLRFYSSVFSLWIGVGLVISAVRLGGYWPKRAWLSSALVGSGLVFLLGLNVVNPEVVIAQENLDNHPATIVGKVDRLSAEGQFVVASRLGELAPEQRAGATAQLCESRPASNDALPDWNRGRARTATLLADLCGSP